MNHYYIYLNLEDLRGLLGFLAVLAVLLSLSSGLINFFTHTKVITILRAGFTHAHCRHHPPLRLLE